MNRFLHGASPAKNISKTHQIHCYYYHVCMSESKPLISPSLTSSPEVVMPTLTEMAALITTLMRKKSKKVHEEEESGKSDSRDLVQRVKEMEIHNWVK